MVVSDTLDGLGGISCTPSQSADLLPGETLDCQAIYPAVTQAQIDAGSITNFATVTATDPDDNPLEEQDSEITLLDQAPAITLNKFVAPAAGSTTGETITFTLTAENTGNTTLNNVLITDSMSGLSPLSCNSPLPTTLAFGETVTCTATYLLNQTDVDSGSVTNSGSVTAVDINGIPVSDTDTATATTLNAPNLAFSKTSDPVVGTALALGDTVTYTLTATNTGNVTLSSVTLADSLPGISPFSCSSAMPGPLPPNGTVVCAATYALSQNDLDLGTLTNSATASGIPPSAPILTRTDSITLALSQTPSIRLFKTASKTSGVDLGETITYTLVATNTGNVTLSNWAISDPLPGLGALSCAQPQGGSLAPDSAISCTAPYTVTLANMNRGVITNTARVSGLDPVSNIITDTADATVIAGQMPDLDLTKSVSPTAGLMLNDRLTYTLVVTNIGNVTLDAVTITDTLPGLSPLVCSPALGSRLDPADSLSCTATYTVTQADIDTGQIFNFATASGIGPNQTPVNETDAASVPLAQNSAISLVKDVASPHGAALNIGDLLTYTFAITNSGNTTLQTAALIDPLAGLSPPSCTPGIGSSLPPDGHISCMAFITVTQLHIDAGAITNTATITATDPLSITVNDRDSAVQPIIQTPDIVLEKRLGSTSGTPDFLTTGDVLTYTFAVTNSGNVTLDNVVVSDPLPGLGPLTCSPAAGSSLSPGQTMGCLATYTVTITDVLNGQIVNTGTVRGQDPQDQPVNDSDVVVVPPTQEPAAELNKTLLGFSDWDQTGDLSLGDVITYALVVSNTGNTPLENVMVNDPLAGLAPLACLPLLGSTLLPAQSLSCTTTLTVTQPLVDDGLIQNSAELTVTVPFTTPVVITDTDGINVPIPQTADILLDKQAATSGTPVHVGETITYTLIATNTGNVTLSNVWITDTLPGLTPFVCSAGQPATLAPGETLRCTTTLEVTQPHIDLSLILNTAETSGVSPGGTTVSATDSASVPIQQNPDIVLIKSVDTATARWAGDTITYTFVATNTGNVTLHSVSISDPLPGLAPLACQTPIPTTLVPGASTSCTASYEYTQADLDAGQILNLATVTGFDPFMNEVSELDPATAVLPQAPELTFIKSALNIGTFTVGDEVIFVFKALNSGNLTLTDVTIEDPFPGLGPISCLGDRPIILAPGESTVCQASYQITEADALAETIENIAIASGRDPQDSELELDDSVQVPIDSNQNPPSETLTLSKLVNNEAAPLAPGPLIMIGDRVSWRYIITNAGQSRVEQISLIDDLEGDIACPQTGLEPNESMTCLAESTAVEGQYRNIAIVTGQPDTVGAELVSAVDVAHYIGSPEPTAVELVNFSARRVGDNQIEISWQTGAEIDTFGFKLLRSTSAQLGQATQIHFEPSSIANENGASYRHTDSNLEFGRYTYWLADVDTSGVETVHGPIQISLGRAWRGFIPFLAR